MRNNINWISIKENGYPKDIDKRVLTYSETYVNDPIMAYRILDSQFLKICSDITHYAFLEKPE